jgi:hypothetical protein
MANFKKVPGADEPSGGLGFLPGLDPATSDRIMTTTTLYWPTALAFAVMILLILKGFRRLAVVAAFAGAVLQGILLEVFW